MRSGGMLSKWRQLSSYQATHVRVLLNSASAQGVRQRAVSISTVPSYPLSPHHISSLYKLYHNFMGTKFCKTWWGYISVFVWNLLFNSFLFTFRNLSKLSRFVGFHSLFQMKTLIFFMLLLRFLVKKYKESSCKSDLPHFPK